MLAWMPIYNENHGSFYPAAGTLFSFDRKIFDSDDNNLCCNEAQHRRDYRHNINPCVLETTGVGKPNG